jgi:hypothetical protein
LFRGSKGDFQIIDHAEAQFAESVPEGWRREEELERVINQDVNCG